MNFFKHSQDNEEGLHGINITPLTDCMLVLLIVFMITGTTLQNSFNIELPTVTQKEEAPSSPIVISITDKGSYYIGETLTSEKALYEELETRGRDLKNPVVIINGDARVSYEKVMKAVDAAKRAGLTQIALSTELEE